MIKSPYMRIAIFHNLKKGGALNSLIFTLKYLKQKNKIDIYSLQKNIPNNLINNLYIYKLKKTKNIFQSLFQILFELNKLNKKIAEDINKKNYDLIIIFPCLLTQSPYILRYLKNKKKIIYFFNEPKREFYEKTSFDYWSPRKILIRIIRLPIKYIDKKNCKSAKYIICNSKFTAKNLKKIYNKNSTVIYPGLKPIKPKKITIQNNKNILSVGQLSKIKGHDFSIQQIQGISKELTILGRPTEETKQIKKIAKKNNISLKIIKTENDKEKNNIYKKYSIYLANNLNEPFGITTLEATSNNCLVLGKKEGGTPEIIKNGINGYLYSNLNQARKIFKKVVTQNKITLTQINTTDWKYTSDKIIEYYKNHIKNEP
jgi:glycosyltransferase involved in cell wall biosynthesis